MEQNNLENQIKERLNSREIMPSAHAWDRLDAMLTVNDKPKRKFGWLYIAASFIGLLFVSSYFFNQQSNDNETIIVDKGIEKVENKERIQNSERIEKNEIAKVDLKQKSEKPTICVFQKVVKSEDMVVVKITEKQDVINNNLPITDNQQLITDNSQPTTANPQPITQNPKPTTIKVDAATLLSQVDGELTLTFREKVIKKYQTVKVALADRNIQK